MKQLTNNAASTRDWLDAAKDIKILASFEAVDTAVLVEPILSDQPLTASQVELGKKIAAKHGLAK